MNSVSRLSVVALVALAACSRSASQSSTSPAPVAAAQARTVAPASTDPRVGLKAGMFDAAEATSGVRVLSKVPSPEGFKGITNSDIAFTGKYAVQGN